MVHSNFYDICDDSIFLKTLQQMKLLQWLHWLQLLFFEIIAISAAPPPILLVRPVMGPKEQLFVFKNYIQKEYQQEFEWNFLNKIQY